MAGTARSTDVVIARLRIYSYEDEQPAASSVLYDTQRLLTPSLTLLKPAEAPKPGLAGPPDRGSQLGA